MSKAAFWQKGESLDYTNSTNATIEANTIMVYGSRIGVIGTDIKPGELGSIHVTGVFEMPLSDASGVTAGAEVYWDGSGITATSGADTTKAGFAAQAAAAGAEKVLVSINA